MMKIALRISTSVGLVGIAILIPLSGLAFASDEASTASGGTSAVETVESDGNIWG